MKYNDLINEFLNLLDEDSDIKKLKVLKKKLMSNKSFLKEIEDYKLSKTVDKKKLLYENQDYLEYLKIETHINILIQEIKNKFNILNSRKCFK